MSFPEPAPTAMAPATAQFELPNMSGQRRAPYRSDINNEPVLPETEARLRCSNRRRLLRCFRMASDSRWIAEWLLSHPTHPFHHHTSIPTDAFDNSLAIRAAHRPAESGGSRGQFAAPPPGPVAPGFDILLVPVAHSHGKLIGYSFGGMSSADANPVDCAWDYKRYPMFPHFVGRFAFDTTQNDLLIVVNRMNEYVTGIMSIRRSDGRGRDRSSFAVANGNYGFKRLPARIISMATMTERRLASIPKYQFAVATGDDAAGGSNTTERRRGAVQTDMGTLRQDLAKLERLVKGKFYTDRMLKDKMDGVTGELSSRETSQLESAFDVKDAIGLQVFRDTAMRSYYSYMASISSSQPGGSGGGSSRSSGGGASSSSSRRRR